MDGFFVCGGHLELSSLQPDALVCFFFFLVTFLADCLLSWHQKLWSVSLTLHRPAGAADVCGCPAVVRRPSVLGQRLCRSSVLISADEFQQPDSLSADLEQ